jgi:hypothetical protein
MSNFKKSLTLVCATLFTLSFQAQAANPAAPPANMQHYTFTYHFDKLQNPVTKITRETQQYINYELVMDIQTSAWTTLHSVNDGLTMVASNVAQDKITDEQTAE